MTQKQYKLKQAPMSGKRLASQGAMAETIVLRCHGMHHITLFMQIRCTAAGLTTIASYTVLSTTVAKRWGPGSNWL